ncbi:zinc carboxypeptidase [Polaribacter aestuariivivens]|uniref:Zinc carboxypeptidase n=1 Tax=Polaribacter aestuariivivens TaxID=2304626 RepID=A0A5S3N1C1_9FLAO|nr:M14 family metallopeptidase [Polaribacter aestuariivivens]TMM28817.1 zinc carboxypeptidase [Polaribacter aestuariivivens]
MKIKAFLVVLVLFTGTLFSQTVQSPSEFLGYEIGSRFTRHHRVVDYFQYVSKTLSNVKMEKYGETNEHRPLYLSYISSQENINNLDQIRKNNLSQSGIVSGNATNKKAIVWLSYNVHGNEASSTEASMLTLYELVTNKKDWLENTIVIIDPCINPDGRDRYVNWYNQVKSTPFNVDQNAKEHSEPWPGGRPNHYLFDLNRDWAWVTQVESAQRIKMYNKWMPHIHVDFHEQYINNPYYFAPAAEPFHEIITDWQRDFQTQIGKNHAKYFDKEGWLYFTKESFDLLYPSYGDTYPTYMGAIGMTYEQAGHGMAGLGINTDEGEVLTLKDRAIHHMTTGLSTVEISSQNAEKLNIEFKKFFNNTGLNYKSYVLKNDNEDKMNRLKTLLDKHEIKYEYATNGSVKGYNYRNQKNEKFDVSANDLVIHTNQPKGKMVKVLFEPNAKLADSLTYDITAWSLPYAHGINAIASTSQVNSSVKSKKYTFDNVEDKTAYAYISKWNSIDDATFLADLLKNDIIPRFSQKAFSADGKSYKEGTLIILRNDNRNDDFDAKLIKVADRNMRQLTAVSTGFSQSGVDFGSASVKPINKQKIAVISGKATSSLSFGEVWHFFETQLKYPITNINSDNFSYTDLSKYDVIIMPSGYYNSVLNKSTLEKVKKWIRSGGTLIAIGNAVNSFANKDGFSLKKKTSEHKADNKNDNLTPFADRERKSVANLITGSIFKSTLDNTHPLAFGYGKEYFSLKLGGTSYEYLKNGYNVGYFNENTKNVSGYAGSKAVKNVPESLFIGEQPIGNGSVVYMVDNPLFRAFWENGKLFVANAVFLLNSDKLK